MFYCMFFSGLPVEAEPVAPHQPSKGANLNTGTEYLGFYIETILVEGCYCNFLVLCYTLLGLR